MAHNTIRHVLTALRGWERTAGGENYINETSERPYSLVGAYKLSLDAHKTDGWMQEIENEILKTIENNFEKMASIAKSDLYSSLNYLRSVWTFMAKDTRSGIESNITNALASFGSDVRLRSRFASGEEADLVMSDCWGKKITCVNLPESLGKGGKIVNVFLKTLMMNDAERNQSSGYELFRFSGEGHFESPLLRALRSSRPNTVILQRRDLRFQISLKLQTTQI